MYVDFSFSSDFDVVYSVARRYLEELAAMDLSLCDVVQGLIARHQQERKGGDLDEAASLWRNIVEKSYSQAFLDLPNSDILKRVALSTLPIFAITLTFV